MKEVVYRYFSGKATPRQQQQIHNWLNGSEENRELYYQWLEAWLEENPTHHFDASVDFEMLRGKIQASDQSGLRSQQETPNAGLRRLGQSWQRIAAAVALLLMVTSIYLLVQAHYGYTTYKTAYGETKTITLPDRSTVRLNANSRLTFRNWNPEAAREVSLTGEAFFSVVHTVNHQKFIVHSGAMDVEVLGTEFNVNNRREVTKVVLSSGKVKLHLDAAQAGNTLIMKPGELVEYAQDRKAIKRRRVDAEHYTAWRNNEWVFDKTTLGEIAQLLRDNYGLEVVLKGDALEQRTFTATLPAGNIDVLLKALTRSFDLRVSRHQSQVTLEEK